MQETSLTPVSAGEIDAIRRTMTSGLPFEPFNLLQPGEPVEVITGPLAGITGFVLKRKDKNCLVITVSVLNHRAVSVQLNRDAVIQLKLSPRSWGSASCAQPGTQRYERHSPFIALD
jgi:transcription antitermination factor NusG